MTQPSSNGASIDGLVENMFRDVLAEDERAELVERIRAWEVENPDLSPGQRISGWIDIAYDYQAGR